MFSTPANKSKKRPRHSEINGAPLVTPVGFVSPMRRCSNIVTSTPAEPLLSNDDEAERQSHQRLSKIVADEEPAARTPLQIEESRAFLGCWLKLAAENKITSKNMWKIHIIELLRQMVRTGGEDITLQMLSATLGASAKVYGLRVDDVYSQMVAFAGELNRRHAVAEDNEVVNEGEIEEEENNNADKSKTKRRKQSRPKTSMLAAPDTLIGAPDLFEIDDSIRIEINNREGDDSAIDNMYQMILQKDPLTSSYDIDYDRIYFDSTEPKPAQAMEVDIEEITLPFDLFEPEKIEKSLLSPVAFPLRNWSLETEDPRMTLTSKEIDVAFDMEAEPLLDVSQSQENVPEPAYSSDEEEGVNAEAPVEGATRHHVQTVNEMIPTNPEQTRHLEYSYNVKPANNIWAGPEHWKLKSISQKIPFRTHVDSASQRPKPLKRKGRKTQIIELVWPEDLSEPSDLTFNKTLNALKPHTMTNWTSIADKLLYPPDLHINIQHQFCFFLKPSIKVKAVAERPVSNVSIDNNQYNYENMNDSAFCNAPELGLPDEDIGSVSDREMDNGDNEQPDEENIEMGDDLLEAPRVIPKTFVPYAKRAKKTDITLIKKEMRTTIFNPNETEISDICGNETIQGGEVKFSEVYKSLKKSLPSEQADGLSCGVALLALTCLATEHSLMLKSLTDLSDALISKPQ